MRFKYRSAALAIAATLVLPALAQPTASVHLSDDELSFHSQTVGVASSIRAVTLTIRGAAVTFSPATIGGANPGDFGVKLDTCSGNTVHVNGTCQIGVAFSPVAAGNRDGKLTLADSAPGKPPVIHLSGTGLNPRITRITILPFNPSLGTDAKLQLAALALYSDGSSKDVTALARWKSSDPDNARVSNADGSKGLATGVTPGKSIITAALDDATGRDTLTIFAVPSLTFSVQPSSTSVSAAIDPIVRVRVVDDHGAPLRGQLLAMSLGPNPPHPAALTGALTQITDAAGTATFPDLKLDYLGQGYTLAVTATTPGGPFTAISTPFNENRVGDPCLGPELPSCFSSCADTDGDGLNDAWENAGGIDVNGDGLITAKYDVLLPGADPNKQDIYVQYDWMDYAPPGNACSMDSECTLAGSAHFGETCSGAQVVPTAPHSCVFQCTADADCTSRTFGSHAGERCVANACVHTHDPEQAPGALQAVIDSFAAHGISLHILRGNPQPHSTVISFRQNQDMTDVCEGGSQSSGTVGPGKYVESFYDLKTMSSVDKPKAAYHYTIFSHYSGCDTQEHCKCPPAKNPDGSPKIGPVQGESGLAEVSGNDFIVSLGGRFQDLGHIPGVFDVGSTFMHELGHNLGLRHGGGIDTPCKTVGAACPNGGFCTQTPVGAYCLGGEEINSKPNYLSVMNYRYQLTGILVGAALGSNSPMACATNLDCPSGTQCNHGSCARLDYSNQILPTGGNTPGSLDQSTIPNLPAVGDPGLGLSEPAGLDSGAADLFTFTDAREIGIPSLAASQGPVDWDGDGVRTATNVQADTICGPAGFADHLCNELSYPLLEGHVDWGPAGQNQFTYMFQCTPYGGATGDGASNLTAFVQHESNMEMFASAHFLYPPRKTNVVIESDCTTPRGQIRVSLLGSTDFDVKEIEQSSLQFHGAKPILVSIADINHDGIPDLIALFDRGSTRLAPTALRGVVKGWLKNSQVFSGEDMIRANATAFPACEGLGPLKF